jgi:tetratricopeptide (TPR) repeat protein
MKRSRLISSVCRLPSALPRTPVYATAIASITALALAGCASKAKRPATTRPSTTRPLATRPIDAKALLTLSQLEPKLDPPRAAATTAPATGPLPPLDAIELYATARDAILTGRRQAAVDLLEKAAALDSQSFEIRYALGKAYLNGPWDERSLAWLLKAAELDPDRVELQTDIGRQLLAKGDWDEGVRRLRLALLASDAESEPAATAVAELDLSKALADRGYDTAAVELLERLRSRVASPSLDVRMNPALFYFVTRPEFLALRAGELYERIGRYDRALAAYAPVADADPTHFESRARVVRTLANAGRFDDAAAAAAEAVAQFRASPESLVLLRDVYRAIGREGQAVEQLRRLHEQRPDDRPLLYALADLLAADERHADAIAVLERAAARDPDDFEIVRRLVLLGQEARPDDGLAAGARLIRWSADHPDSIHVMSALWSQLVRPRPEGRLRPATVEALDVGPSVSPRLQAARLYWASRVAGAAGRRAVVRDTLRRVVAIDATPPFAPAYRGQLDALWSRNDLTPDQKASTSNELADRAKRLGDASLGEELRGLSLLNQKKPNDALEAFDQAVNLGGRSPDLQLGRALAARAAGDVPRFEQLLWKLIGDWPQYDDGYETLYAHYVQSGAGPQADKVLSTWQSADGQSVSCRLARVRRYFAAGNPSVGEKLLLETFDDAPDHPQVHLFLEALFRETDRVDNLADRFRTKLADNPADLTIVSRLVDLDVERGRQRDAVWEVDAARKAVGDADADALYQIAHLYLDAGQKQASEQALRDALNAEPAHGPAANDLGYALADRGEDLTEAERLARLAVASEPDNGAFLDSLGWVLYKRGRFAEAGEQLSRALAITPRPDPVMLDHLGDALYRAGQASNALTRWKAAAERLAATAQADADRDDIKTLRLELDRKLKQAAAGEPVSVAPVAVDPAAPAVPSQAKN